MGEIGGGLRELGVTRGLGRVQVLGRLHGLQPEAGSGCTAHLLRPGPVPQNTGSVMYLLCPTSPQEMELPNRVRHWRTPRDRRNNLLSLSAWSNEPNNCRRSSWNIWQLWLRGDWRGYEERCRSIRRQRASGWPWASLALALGDVIGCGSYVSVRDKLLLCPLSLTRCGAWVSCGRFFPGMAY